jgi:ubiquinone/menaquinone biosynthesis C-methylase UbiE
MSNKINPGDFTGLAIDYANYRPDYCRSVLKALIGLLGKSIKEVDFVDVGAGTGIWTKMVQEEGVRTVTAVEPNDDMRNAGKADKQLKAIKWLAGNAENTGLDDTSVDWLTMASSFHWAKFNESTKEFYRVLRPGGRFTALWNPRLIEANPLLVEIEDFLNKLNPDIKRISSGRSGITEKLSDMLWASPWFDDVVYTEGRHVISMSRERYIGAWRSVNDIRVQLGPVKFETFMKFVEQRTKSLQVIEATYLTRAWTAKRKE